MAGDQPWKLGFFAAMAVHSDLCDTKKKNSITRDARFTQRTQEGFGFLCGHKENTLGSQLSVLLCLFKYQKWFFVFVVFHYAI